MSNRFVVIDEPTISQGFESFYFELAEIVENKATLEKAFKTIEKGFEAFYTLNQIKKTIEKSEFTSGLESSVVNTFNYYKDIVEDYKYSASLIALESYQDTKTKKAIALEGIGNFLKRIWKT